MFSDLFEALRDWWRATLKPAWKNLLSQKSNTAMTLAVILLLEVLLCVLFISHANNQAAANSMEVEFKAYEAIAGIDLKEQTEATMEGLYSNLSLMRRLNNAVFIFATVVWFLISAFIFSKLISSSVELRKYVYGLYITFGANTKKIRRLIFAQMMSLGLGALLLAIPIAYLLCGCIYGFVSIKNISFGDLLLVLLLVALLLVTVIGAVAHSITSKPCVSLLAASDVSNYVRSPKRSKRRIFASNASRLARISLSRMRRHYLPLVISAVLPACLFFCCMSLARSNEQRQQDTLTEYTVHFKNGITASTFQNSVLPALEGIDGILSVTPVGGGGLGAAGAHILLEKKNMTADESFSTVYSGTAYDNIKIISGDAYSLHAKGIHPKGSGGKTADTFEMTAPAKGYVTMVYPATVWGSYPEKYTPVFDLNGGTVYITYADATAQTQSLTEKAEGAQELGLSLCATASQVINDRYQTTGFPPSYDFISQRLDEELLILHPDDFYRLTGIDVYTNIDSGIATPPVSLADLGSYLVTDTGYSSHIESVPYGGFYAGNEFTVDVSDAYAYEKYGIGKEIALSQSEGKATLVLSPASKLSQSLSSFYLSGVTKVETDATLENALFLSPAEFLMQTVNHYPQSYTRYEIANVIVSDAVSTDVLLLPENEVAVLFGRTAAYSEIEIEVPVDISAGTLIKTLSSLHGWMQKSDMSAEEPTLSEAGELWQAITVEKGRYTPVARTLAVLLLLSIPFIWFCPQYNHYQKRKSDLETLCLLGQPRSRVLKILLCEGFLLGVLSAVFTAIFCPIFTFATFEFLKFSGFPFAYSSLDTAALIGVTVFSMLCAFAFTTVNYVFLFPRRAKNSDNGNVFEKE